MSQAHKFRHRTNHIMKLICPSLKLNNWTFKKFPSETAIAVAWIWTLLIAIAMSSPARSYSRFSRSAWSVKPREMPIKETTIKPWIKSSNYRVREDHKLSRLEWGKARNSSAWPSRGSQSSKRKWTRPNKVTDWTILTNSRITRAWWPCRTAS